jgi:hypothetical protein
MKHTDPQPLLLLNPHTPPTPRKLQSTISSLGDTKNHTTSEEPLHQHPFHFQATQQESRPLRLEPIKKEKNTSLSPSPYSTKSVPYLSLEKTLLESRKQDSRYNHNPSKITPKPKSKPKLISQDRNERASTVLHRPPVPRRALQYTNKSTHSSSVVITIKKVSTLRIHPAVSTRR